MAGNIIPAIATTNAVIAGVVVLRAFHVLRGQFERCPSVYLRPRPDHRVSIIVVVSTIYMISFVYESSLGLIS